MLAFTWFREIPVVWVCPDRYTLTLSLSLDWFHFTLQLPDPPALEPGRGARAALYLSLPFLSSCLHPTHAFQSEPAWLVCALKISLLQHAATEVMYDGPTLTVNRQVSALPCATSNHSTASWANAGQLLKGWGDHHLGAGRPHMAI